MTVYDALDDLSFKSAYNYEKSHKLNSTNNNTTYKIAKYTDDQPLVTGRKTEYIISEDDYLLLQSIKKQQLPSRGKPREETKKFEKSSVANTTKNDVTDIDKLRKQYIEERHQQQQRIRKEEKSVEEKPPLLPERSYKHSARNSNGVSASFYRNNRNHLDSKGSYYNTNSYVSPDKKASIISNPADSITLVDLKEDDDSEENHPIIKGGNNSESASIDRSPTAENLKVESAVKSDEDKQDMSKENCKPSLPKNKKPIIPPKHSSINFVDSLSCNKLTINHNKDATSSKTLNGIIHDNDSTNFIDSLSGNKLTNNKSTSIPSSPSKRDLNINRNIDYLDSLQKNDTTSTTALNVHVKNNKPAIPDKPTNLAKKDAFLSSILKNSTSTKNLNILVDDKYNTLKKDTSKKQAPKIPTKSNDIYKKINMSNGERLELPKLKKVQSPMKDKSSTLLSSNVTDEKNKLPKLKPIPPVKKDGLSSQKTTQNNIDDDRSEIVNISIKLKKTVIPPKVNRENKPTIKLNKVGTVTKHTDEPIPEALLKRGSLNKFTASRDDGIKSQNESHLSDLNSILLQSKKRPEAVSSAPDKTKFALEKKQLNETQTEIEHKTKNRVRGPQRRVPKSIR